MRLDLSAVFTIFRTEIRMVLRDRRAVIVSIILPMMLMPLMLLGTRWTIKKHETKISQATWKYSVAGSQSNAVRALIDATRSRMATTTNQFRALEQPATNALQAVRQGRIDFVVEGLTLAEARSVETNKDVLFDDGQLIHETKKSAALPPLVARIVFRGDYDQATAGAQWMRNALGETRNANQAQLLKKTGFPLESKQVFPVSTVNLAVPGQVAGLSLGRTLTLFLLFFVFIGSAMVATDLLAGEKERGTLETLLTSAAGRVEIICAKHLVIITVAMITTAIQACTMLFCASFRLLPVPDGLSQALSPGVVLLLFVLYIPMAALAAGVLLLTSGYAKTHKEAQMLFLPVLLLGLLPAIAPFLPGLSLHSIVVLVPIANIALAVKSILAGSFDWPMIIAAWVATAAAAVWVLRMGVRALSTERLITAAETDEADLRGGPALFERRVLVWFAVLWGVLMTVNNYVGAVDIRIQITINMLCIFFLASVLMIRRYRLDVRSTLSLRLPKPAVWLAVVLGVPGGMLTGAGVMHLANYVIPVPPKMIESFSQAVAPNNISMVQLLFFLAVLPGVFEEIAFRGLLLQGLRRKMRPVLRVIAVGLFFGFFHMALFRLAPTAFLGMLLATVTLLSGSIFPAMLWHILNNALSILAYQWQMAISELDGPYFLAGPVFLACAFWILWRCRVNKSNQ